MTFVQLSGQARLRAAGLLGTLEMILGVLADLASGFSTTGTADILTPFSVLDVSNLEAFLASKSHEQVLLGHYLAIVGIPLGLFGLWQVCRGIRPAGRIPSGIVWGVGVFAFVAGTVFHASFAYMTTLFRVLPGATPAVESALRGILARYIHFFEPLAVVLILTMGISLGLVLYAGLFRRTRYPAWFALFNPLVIQAGTGGLALVAPEGLKIFLIVTTYNLSIAIFFLVSTVLLWDTKPSGASLGEHGLLR